MTTNDDSFYQQRYHCFYNSSGVIEADGLETGKIVFSLECFFYKLQSDLKFTLLAFSFLVFIALDVSVNSIVLISILLEKTRKRIDLCFMSNAVSDLLIGLVIMPFTAIYTCFGYFPMGAYTCFLWNILDFTVGTVSMLHILYISYDRYLSVSKPLKYTQKTNDKFSMTGLPTYLILLFIWFFSAVIWIPVILYLKSKNPVPANIFTANSSLVHQSELDIQDDYLSDCSVIATPAIIVPHSILVYYIPMSLILLFYSKTIKIVSQKVKKRRSSTVSLKFMPSVTAPEFSNTDENENQIRMLAKRNSIFNRKIENSEIYKHDKSSSNIILNNDSVVNLNGCGDIQVEKISTVSFEIDIPQPRSSIVSTSNTDNEYRADLLGTYKDSSKSNFYACYSVNSMRNFKTINSNLKTSRLCSSLENLKNSEDNNFSKKNSLQVNKTSDTSANPSKIYIIRSNNSFTKFQVNNSKSSMISSKQKLDGSTTSTLNNISNNFGILKKSKTGNSPNTKKLSFSSSFLELNDTSKVDNVRAKVRSDLNIVDNVSLIDNGNDNNQFKRRISYCSLATQTRSLSNSNREKGVTYKLGFIMCTFLICWLPFSFLWPFLSVYPDYINQNLYVFSFWLAYANSVFTPLILFYNNAKYRQALFWLKNFLCRQFRKKEFSRSGFNLTNTDANSFISPRSMMKS